MCGVAGYINLKKKNFSPDHQKLLHAMQETIVHRGPDGHGVWHSADHGLGLAHRRLSIIDLSANGAQPMRDKAGTVVVSFNGEIYNHRELRKELEALGHEYFSDTDTETIIYAYKQWGIDCIKRFEGMFAIALFDLRADELYLIRDRIGIKPLYFSVQGEVLSFASEIKALWPLPWVKRSINTRGLYHYLTFMVTPAPLTLYDGVYKMPSAFYAKVDNKRNLTFHEWYSPITSISAREQKDFESEEFCVENIRTLLRSSIKKRMMSDVPFGVFLSGGVDSSLNVALMSEFTDKVKTFNVSFSDGPEYSEVEWARKVAREFGTDHHEIVINEKDAHNFFATMVHHQDEPIADCVCVPLFHVSKLLKDSGVTVVQVGEGSDELFCGYSSYAQHLDVYNKYWKPSQKFIPAFAKKSAYHILATLFPHKQNRLDMIKNWASNRSLFWSGATVFSENWKKTLVRDVEHAYDPMLEKIYAGMRQDNDSYAVVDYHLNQLAAHDGNADFLKSMIYLELKQRLPELLLMRVDKMTMATSVEGRVPFLDHKLVEFALHVPTKFKYRDGVTKYILKKACEGILPHDVIYRKKMGFAAPTSRWFKTGQHFKPHFQQLVRDTRNTWGAYLDSDVIEQMYKNNLTSPTECAVQLWTLQNVMACKTK